MTCIVVLPRNREGCRIAEAGTSCGAGSEAKRLCTIECIYEVCRCVPSGRWIDARKARRIGKGNKPAEDQEQEDEDVCRHLWRLLSICVRVGRGLKGRMETGKLQVDRQTGSMGVQEERRAAGCWPARNCAALLRWKGSCPVRDPARLAKQMPLRPPACESDAILSRHARGGI